MTTTLQKPIFQLRNNNDLWSLSVYIPPDQIILGSLSQPHGILASSRAINRSQRYHGARSCLNMTNPHSISVVEAIQPREDLSLTSTSHSCAVTETKVKLAPLRGSLRRNIKGHVRGDGGGPSRFTLDKPGGCTIGGVAGPGLVGGGHHGVDNCAV
jgi:hypothetical protein